MPCIGSGERRAPLRSITPISTSTPPPTTPALTTPRPSRRTNVSGPRPSDERGRRSPIDECFVRIVMGKSLLDVHLRTSLGQFLLDRLGVGLRHAILDGLGGAVDQVLGLFQAQVGDLADGLD